MGQLFQGTVGEIVTITETLRQNDTGCLFSGEFSDVI